MVKQGLVNIKLTTILNKNQNESKYFQKIIMNIQTIICWQCHKKVDKLGNTYFLNEGYEQKLNIDNNLFYEFTCPEGHLNFAIQGNNKFEIL